MVLPDDILKAETTFLLPNNDFVAEPLVVDLATFPTFTYGQVTHGLLHLNMPLQDLLGLEWEGATLALMSISPIVLGLL